MHKLHESTALARGNLDISDLAEALEEGTELVLSDVSREATDEDGSVVWISELVHLTTRHLTTGHLATRLHASVTLVRVEWSWLLHAPANRLHGISHHRTAVTATIEGVLVASVAQFKISLRLTARGIAGDERKIG